MYLVAADALVDSMGHLRLEINQGTAYMIDHCLQCSSHSSFCLYILEACPDKNGESKVTFVKCSSSNKEGCQLLSSPELFVRSPRILNEI